MSLEALSIHGSDTFTAYDKPRTFSQGLVKISTVQKRTGAVTAYTPGLFNPARLYAFHADALKISFCLAALGASHFLDISAATSAERENPSNYKPQARNSRV